MSDLLDANNRIGVRGAEIFREIIRTGSTRRAARELGITQSAVSQHLKAFEGTLGEQLFERNYRGLIPTARAIEIYSRIDRYFEILGQLETEISASFRSRRSSLVIAAPHILSLDLVPKMVLALNGLDSSLEFHVKAQRYDQMVQSVLTGEADIGISRLPLDDRFFEWEMLLESRSVCLMRPDHRLAGRKLITVDDIADEPLVVLEREYTSRKGGFLTFGRREVLLNCKIHCDSIGLDASYVTHGIGISIDNSFMAQQYKMFNLTVIPFEPALTYEYVVFWRRGSDRFSRQAAIIKSVVDVVRRQSSMD